MKRQSYRANHLHGFFAQSQSWVKFF